VQRILNFQSETKQIGEGNSLQTGEGNSCSTDDEEFDPDRIIDSISANTRILLPQHQLNKKY